MWICGCIMSYYTHILAKYDVSDCTTFEDVKSKFPDTNPAFLRKVIYLKGLAITKEGKLAGASREIGHVQQPPSASSPTRVGPTTKSAHVDKNLLEQAPKMYGKDRSVSLHLLRFPVEDSNLFEAIKMKAWEHAFPDEWVLRKFQSMKPVLLFLDENDSDFSSYLFEILKTNQNFLPYYVDYVHLKRRQKTFAQTLLSLLFLESMNVQTGRMFAEDVIRTIREAIRRIDYTWVDRRMKTRTASLFQVFLAFLSGTEKKRALSINFLKCMRCYPGHLRLFGFPRDLRDQEDTVKLFSDVLTWIFLSEEQKTRKLQRKFLACTGNIPIEDVKPEYLGRAGLKELFNQISRKPFKEEVKFCLVSHGEISQEYTESGMHARQIQHTIEEVFEIVRIPFATKVVDTEKLTSGVLKDLTAPGAILGSVKSDLVPNNVLKEFSKIIVEQNQGNVKIIDIANDLSALVGVAMQKSPRTLTLDDVHALFDVVRRPVPIRRVVISRDVSTGRTLSQQRRRVCWR